MKTIKVSKATGPALDWLVAKCEGCSEKRLTNTAMWLHTRQQGAFRFSTYWSEGGPIIDREDIFFSPLPDMGLRAFQFKDGQYLNIVDCWPYKEQPTRLVLGMRCYVTSKLGDTAEVPEELV